MTPRRPKYRFLDVSENNLSEIGVFPRPLEGRVEATPPRFEPLEDRDPLDDGVPPTALGEAVMRYWAAATGRDASECPTSLVRNAEAMLCGITGNIDKINQAVSGGKAVWEANHAGRMFAIEGLRAWTPMVAPAILQPRGNTGYGPHLRQLTPPGKKWDVIYKVGDGLTLEGESADHFRAIHQAQLKELDPREYRGERQQFVDSLALEGVKERVRAFMFDFSAPDEGNSHIAATGDGFTRTSVAQGTMSDLMDGIRTDFWSIPWERDGGHTLAPWTAADVQDAFDRMRFDAAPFAVWPTPEPGVHGARVTASRVSAHFENASPAAQAVLRLMTLPMTLTLVVEPFDGHSTNAAVYADMARFHDPRHNPAQWRAQDQRAHVAKTIADELAVRGHITEDELAVMTRSDEVPWTTDESRQPFVDRLRAVTQTVMCMSIQDADDPDQKAAVRFVLRELQTTNSPKMSAACGASLAVPLAGVDGNDANAVIAMMARAFAANDIRKVGGKKPRWNDLVNLPVEDLYEAASAELDALLDTEDHGKSDPAAMMALAILGMIAHSINPTLIGYRRAVTAPDGTTTDKRFPSSMTLTGRGNRANIRGGSADAHQITLNMARSPLGQAQLRTIIEAVTSQEAPTLPVHDGVELLEDDLRRMWSNKPDRHGNPVEPTPQPSHDDDGSDAAPDPLDPRSRDTSGLGDQDAWDDTVDMVRDQIRRLAAWVDVLSDIPVGPDLWDGDAEDWDPEDLTLPKMLETIGIERNVSEGVNRDLAAVQDFFNDGLIALLTRLDR